MASAVPAYAIVVVTWRSARQLERLVESMNRELRSEPELIVVENASGEDPEPAAGRWRGEVRVIREPTNLGFGAASNHGVQATRREAVVLLNPDTELLDAGLDRLAALAVRDDVLAGPRLLNSDRTLQPSASGPQVGVWPWVQALVPGALQPAAALARTEPWRLSAPTQVAWLTGACVAGRRETLAELGPFDPAIELFAEDLDLGLRAGAVGIKSWFRPDLCAIVHHGSASTSIRFAPREEMALAAGYRAAVLRRAYGRRRERLAAAAELLNLGLRAGAKRVLRRGGERELALLGAARAARRAPELPPLADRDGPREPPRPRG